MNQHPTKSDTLTRLKWILVPVLCGMLVGCGNQWSSGDRVLVSKCSYDNGFTHPHRYDVVVFKWPGDRPGKGPMDNNTPKNYIKRLLGLPGELLAIFFGRIYRWTPAENGAPAYDDDKTVKDTNELLKKFPYMHVDDEKTRAWFEEGQFEILRKTPAIMLAMRRLVYDNDFQAKDLKGKLDRWSPSPKSGWKTDAATGFASDARDGDVDWLHYQHLLRPEAGQPVVGGDNTRPKLITDTMAYNSLKTVYQDPNTKGFSITDRTPHHPHWVGDLMLECNVEIVQPSGEFVLELNKGIFRYQARWDLATGVCKLKSIDIHNKETDLGSKDTNLKGSGNHFVRLANFDSRLTVWVNRSLPFGDGVDYDPPEIRSKKEGKLSDDELAVRRGPHENDVKRPASIGSKGANVKVTHVGVWRDTYYVTSVSPGADYESPTTWSNPQDWDGIRKARFSTMYVQPGHYLCLGDNSQASSDSRDWGLVPERLMLGRALVVYFPFERIGLIR
jgi:signal peptidase I